MDSLVAFLKKSLTPKSSKIFKEPMKIVQEEIISHGATREHNRFFDHRRSKRRKHDRKYHSHLFHYHLHYLPDNTECPSLGGPQHPIQKSLLKPET